MMTAGFILSAHPVYEDRSRCFRQSARGGTPVRPMLFFRAHSPEQRADGERRRAAARIWESEGEVILARIMGGY